MGSLPNIQSNLLTFGRHSEATLKHTEYMALGPVQFSHLLSSSMQIFIADGGEKNVGIKQEAAAGVCLE